MKDADTVTDLDYAAAMDYLFGRINYEQTPAIPYRTNEFKLDRMNRLMRLLGDPQRSFPAVHIAGTKGKGSTAHMIASILGTAGFKTGLYTSPHLHRIEERYVIDGQLCPPQEFAALVSQIQPIVAEMDRAAHHAEFPSQGPTFFELTTAIAFLHFASQQVDAAVLEVGLGGRLDSTNVCSPAATVITSISFDHMKQLGNTLAAIAFEKAGIIKPGTCVISGVDDEEPRDVIERVAGERESPLHLAGRDFKFRYGGKQVLAAADGRRRLGCQFDYQEMSDGRRTEFRDVQLPLVGMHQAANGAVAIATAIRLREAGWQIPDEAILEGLRNVRCPARIELLAASPAVVLDAAHNDRSVQALVSVLDEAFSDTARKTLIFATSQDKDAAAMLRLLLPKFQRVIFTRYRNNPRFVDPNTLADLASEILASEILAESSRSTSSELEVTDHVGQAWEFARSSSGPDDLICIAGSFFLAAEARDLVLRHGDAC